MVLLLVMLLPVRGPFKSNLDSVGHCSVCRIPSNSRGISISFLNSSHALVG